MNVLPVLAEPLPLAGPEFELVLFINGPNARSVQALRNVEQLCARHLAGRYSLTVVDVAQHPERAIEEQVLGLPCLLKKRPGLVRRIIGDFIDEARVLKALGLPPA
jgi:circadian clock protein KaiB